jgi:thioredoxin 1
MLRSLAACLLTAAICAGTGCAQEKSPEPPPGREKHATVTFVELGSVKCVPCRMMQPVMKAIEEKYGGQIRVVFHDVWTDSGRALGEPYKIRAIPTQVFLDGNGAEFHRREGFYPEAEIDKLLQSRGLKVLPPAK